MLWIYDCTEKCHNQFNNWSSIYLFSHRHPLSVFKWTWKMQFDCVQRTYRLDSNYFDLKYYKQFINQTIVFEIKWRNIFFFCCHFSSTQLIFIVCGHNRQKGLAWSFSFNDYGIHEEISLWWFFILLWRFGKEWRLYIDARGV